MQIIITLFQLLTSILLHTKTISHAASTLYNPRPRASHVQKNRTQSRENVHRRGGRVDRHGGSIKSLHKPMGTVVRAKKLVSIARRSRPRRQVTASASRQAEDKRLKRESLERSRLSNDFHENCCRSTGFSMMIGLDHCSNRSVRYMEL